MSELNLFDGGGIDPDANAGIFHHPETGQPLRWLLLDEVVWLYFGDLCHGAGHSNPSAAINLVDDEDKKKVNMWSVFAGRATLSFLRAGTTGGNAETWFVTEEGFVTLDLAARGDGPRMFRRWVVKVVIPQFRRARRDEPAVIGDNHDLDLIENMIAAIRADRRRLAALEARQAELAAGQRLIEAKVAAIEDQHDRSTALGYAKLNDCPTDRPFLARVGKQATAIMRDRGEKPERRQDATFGTVNVYPIDVLEQAFEAVTS
ncbi:Bro-N domain-containing protein [Actinomadura sp. HBU206391]|uniref:BRO-N domain-containing protein n=1 Tax=Actinomadura sp. HBU206391 TaxID=2731692 RepID=UPI00164F6009|nr:Bro-N domain-containing protein [Actinomadura sp. HBU206391]MBC6458815.1 Bro-N domain-containing protein [Actinomadura sp. HBU206391]